MNEDNELPQLESDEESVSEILFRLNLQPDPSVYKEGLAIFDQILETIDLKTLDESVASIKIFAQNIRQVLGNVNLQDLATDDVDLFLLLEHNRFPLCMIQLDDLRAGRNLRCRDCNIYMILMSYALTKVGINNELVYRPSVLHPLLFITRSDGSILRFDTNTVGRESVTDVTAERRKQLENEDFAFIQKVLGGLYLPGGLQGIISDLTNNPLNIGSHLGADYFNFLDLYKLGKSLHVLRSETYKLHAKAITDERKAELNLKLEDLDTLISDVVLQIDEITNNHEGKFAPQIIYLLSKIDTNKAYKVLTQIAMSRA